MVVTRTIPQYLVLAREKEAPKTERKSFYYVGVGSSLFKKTYRFLLASKCIEKAQ